MGEDREHFLDQDMGESILLRPGVIKGTWVCFDIPAREEVTPSATPMAIKKSNKLAPPLHALRPPRPHGGMGLN